MSRQPRLLKRVTLKRRAKEAEPVSQAFFARARWRGAAALPSPPNNARQQPRTKRAALSCLHTCRLCRSDNEGTLVYVSQSIAAVHSLAVVDAALRARRSGHGCGARPRRRSPVRAGHSPPGCIPANRTLSLLCSSWSAPAGRADSANPALHTASTHGTLLSSMVRLAGGVPGRVGTGRRCGLAQAGGGHRRTRRRRASVMVSAGAEPCAFFFANACTPRDCSTPYARIAGFTGSGRRMRAGEAASRAWRRVRRVHDAGGVIPSFPYFFT